MVYLSVGGGMVVCFSSWSVGDIVVFLQEERRTVVYFSRGNIVSVENYPVVLLAACSGL